MMNGTEMHIVAPVSSADEARRVLGAGADELYCGAMFDYWRELYGDADLISRRQGRFAHVRQPEELEAIVQTATSFGAPVALALNGRYSHEQENLILELAERWEEAGGTSVIVTDPSLLFVLQQRGSRLKRHLSLLAGVFNSLSARFFSELGVSRVILSRHLDIREMRELIEGTPDLEYEALAINQKCQFLDGMCGFYHGTRIPDDSPAAFEYETSGGRDLPLVRTHDPEYEGHGCQISWETGRGPVKNLERDDQSGPHCAACLLMHLREAGVHFYKVAGRGYPGDMIVRSVRFLRDAARCWSVHRDGGGALEEIRRTYAETFGGPCKSNRCYYEFP